MQSLSFRSSRVILPTRGARPKVTQTRRGKSRNAFLLNPKLGTLASLVKPNPTAKPAYVKPAPYKRVKMIVVYGYMCDRFQKDMRRRERNLKYYAHPDIESVELLCNTNTSHSMTFDIWARLFWSGKLLEPTPFVVEVLKKVCKSLQEYDEVILLGHSYGGSVVARVGLFLHQYCSSRSIQHLDLRKRLRIMTFGSIFVPPPEILPKDIRMDHIMYKNDVAKFCHKLNKSKCTYVLWLQPRPGKNPLLSHLDYDRLILDIAKNGGF
jgi:hypothetical protein